LGLLGRGKILEGFGKRRGGGGANDDICGEERAKSLAYEQYEERGVNRSKSSDVGVTAYKEPLLKGGKGSEEKREGKEGNSE